MSYGRDNDETIADTAAPLLIILIIVAIVIMIIIFISYIIGLIASIIGAIVAIYNYGRSFKENVIDVVKIRREAINK